VDVRSFTKILSEIVAGVSSGDGEGCPIVPSFVSEIIERGQSFLDIFETLEQNQFQIMEGINVAEVSNFVRWIQWSETLTE
jgi:hypothetical protein